jgi:hypothetical protein
MLKRSLQAIHQQSEKLSRLVSQLIELVDKVIGARQTPPASAQAHRSPDAV